MGVSQQSHGSALRLIIDDEQEIFAETLAQLRQAKAALTDDEDDFLIPSADILSGCKSLEDLFEAFAAGLLRDETGAVIAMTGYDHRLRPVDYLVESLAPCLADGSWFAYSSEAEMATVLSVKDGVSTLDWLDVYSLVPDYVLEGLGGTPNDYLSPPPPLPLPIAPEQPYHEQITTMVRLRTRKPYLLPCYAGWDWLDGYDPYIRNRIEQHNRH